MIVGLRGGLGNQLFQFASGFSLARKTGRDLLLDCEVYRKANFRRFELRSFKTEVREASRRQIRQLTRWKGGFVDRAWGRLWGRRLPSPSTFIEEPHYHFWPGLERVGEANIYMYGYWQSHRYFDSVQSELRRLLTWSKPLSRNAEAIAGAIAASNSVAVHVRRGDYVRNQRNRQIYAECEMGFYSRAVEFVAGRVPGAKFFVFSDDIDWTRAHLRVEAECRYVERGESPDCGGDLRLMSTCQHNIIANSSYSWWAAWLNANDTKMVVAPKRWFVAPALSTRDLVPDKWTVI